MNGDIPAAPDPTLAANVDDPDDDPVAPSVPGEFCVRDAQTANWVVRRIVEARAYAAHVEAWAAREVRRARRDERFFLDRYGPQLADWTRRQVAALGGRRKSVNLPAGSVGFRAVAPTLAVRDERALLAWCRANLPAAVVSVERLVKAAVNDHVAATGEVPQGAEVVDGGERFFVR